MRKHLTLSTWWTFKGIAIVIVGSMILAACAPAATPTTVPTAVPTVAPATEAPSAMDAMIAAAKAEGTLTTIALPHDWCNYGGVIDGFKAKYGLAVNELNPDAGSGDEVEAIKANKDNKGPQAPDVIDVGFAFGPSSKTDDLLQPYKVSTWDSIPAEPHRPLLTEAQRRELERRLADHAANPDDVVPWEQVKAEALARFQR